MKNEIILQVGVKVLLQNKEGKYLLLHRSLKKYPNVIKDPWDIAGGRINPGSKLLDNLQREVMEETKLKIIGEPRLIAAQDIMRTANKHVVRLTYLGKADGEVVLDDENDRYKWCTWEELLSLDEIDIYLKELLDKKIICPEKM